MVPNTPDDTDNADEQGLVALSGTGPLTPVPAVPEEETSPADSSTPVAPVRQRRTRLHVIINELWGIPGIDDWVYGELIKHADPDSAKKSGNGFQLKLLTGNTIVWGLAQGPGGAPQEVIEGSNKGFKQADAEAMVTLAVLRGWSKIHVHGSVAHKEMLWLAVQHKNLVRKAEFERQQAAGLIPATAVYPPIVVEGFAPLTNSKVYQQWKQEEAAFNASHPPLAEEPAKEAVPAAPASQQEQPAPAEAPAPVAAAPVTPAPAKRPAARKAPARARKEFAIAAAPKTAPVKRTAAKTKTKTPLKKTQKAFTTAAAPRTRKTAAPAAVKAASVNHVLKKAPAKKAHGRQRPEYTRQNPHPPYNARPKRHAR